MLDNSSSQIQGLVDSKTKSYQFQRGYHQLFISLDFSSIVAVLPLRHYYHCHLRPKPLHQQVAVPSARAVGSSASHCIIKSLFLLLVPLAHLQAIKSSSCCSFCLCRCTSRSMPCYPLPYQSSSLDSNDGYIYHQGHQHLL